MSKLGVITDEIGQDLEHALDVMEELGLKYVELQSLWDKDVAKLTRDELKRVRAMISHRGMEVSCIAARMFFNLPLRAGPEEKCYWGSYSEHLEDLRRAIEIAKELGTGIVRTFSFKNETLLEPAFFGDSWGMLLEKFNEPAKIAEEEGITLAVETCMFSNIGTCILARRFMDDLGSKNVKVLWDVVNCLYLGERPYPEGYELIKDDIVHVHVKDGVLELPRMAFNFCAPGKGNVGNYPEIVEALERDGYEGVLSFECEYVPEGGTKEDGVRASVAAFHGIMNTEGIQ